MQNFNRLRELAKVRQEPFSETWNLRRRWKKLLLSAEYIMAGGNYDVILCERGIRTFETYHAQYDGYFGDSDHS